MIPPPIITPPVFVPPYILHPVKCPHCNQDELRIEVCGHCGYKYEPDKGDRGSAILGSMVILCIVLFVAIFIVTMLHWLFPFEGHPTLLAVLKDEWAWLISLRLW